MLYPSACRVACKINAFQHREIARNKLWKFLKGLWAGKGSFLGVGWLMNSREKVNQMNTRPSMVWTVFCLALLLGVIGCASTLEKSSRTIPRMSKEELKSRLQDPSLVILDVRRPQDWKKSGKKIQGAAQENPFKFDTWYARYPKEKTILLY